MPNSRSRSGDPGGGIGRRKADHLRIAAGPHSGFRNVSTLLECVRLVHDALPDMAVDEVDPSVELLGKRLRAPLVIASMTGGAERSAKVNLALARLADRRGIAFGLGSQRAMHRDPKSRWTYDVRKVAPNVLLLGNLGVVQAGAMRSAEVREIVESVGADALCVHLNAAMELVQPEGDRDFRGGLETIARLVQDLPVPVIVKETGCGLSPMVGKRVREAGVSTVDVSGAGGTSWVGIETQRADREASRSRAIGEALWDWGIPTAASVALLRPLGFRIIATGGIKNGLDVARALAIGASAAGIARSALQAFTAGGDRGAEQFIDGVVETLRAAMLLSGARTVADLQRAPRVIVGELREWLEQL